MTIVDQGYSQQELFGTRQRFHGSKDKGYHTTLEPKEAAMAYRLAQAMNLSSYKPSPKQLEAIALTITDFRRKGENGQEVNEVTSQMIASLLRHIHLSGLTLEDFAD